jgi:nucleotide-binding universal stress UspA family protein
MSSTFLVGIDGSAGAARAAHFAAERARAEGGRLILAHIVHWSPHDTITQEEQAERHVQRQREIDRAQTELLRPLAGNLSDGGVTVETVVRHGHVTESLCDIAREEDVKQIFTGRRGRSKVQALLFGSVAGSLVQVAPVPVTVVP